MYTTSTAHTFAHCTHICTLHTLTHPDNDVVDETSLGGQSNDHWVRSLVDGTYNPPYPSRQAYLDHQPEIGEVKAALAADGAFLARIVGALEDEAAFVRILGEWLQGHTKGLPADELRDLRSAFHDHWLRFMGHLGGSSKANKRAEKLTTQQRSDAGKKAYGTNAKQSMRKLDCALSTSNLLHVHIHTSHHCVLACHGAATTDTGLAAFNEKQRQGQVKGPDHHSTGCMLCWYVALGYQRSLLGSEWSKEKLADYKGPPPCFQLCAEAGYKALHDAQESAGVKTLLRRTLWLRSRRGAKDHHFLADDRERTQTSQIAKVDAMGDQSASDLVKKLHFPFDSSQDAARKVLARYAVAMAASTDNTAPRIWGQSIKEAAGANGVLD